MITDPTSKKTVSLYDSYPNGVNDPGALNVEFDFMTAPYAVPTGNAFARVWGISIQDIAQARNLNGKLVAIYGGMQKGLPLANPAQAGLLISGQILQAYGNWIGTDMTLDMQVVAAASPDVGGPTTPPPQNIVINWKAGTPLAQAIATALTTAFPTYKQTINISKNLVLATDEKGFYGNLTQFAQYLKQISQDVVGGTYQGVDIVVGDSSFNVYDGTTVTTPKQIQFTDLIGQPVAFGPLQISMNCVMRADLSVGDYIKMPPALVETTQNSLSQYKQSSIYQGSFQIDTLRHVGNFRQPSGMSWITTIQAHQASAGT